MLLTGVPGTGKTTLGSHLNEEDSFRHLDFETPTVQSFIGDGSETHIRKPSIASRRSVAMW